MGVIGHGLWCCPSSVGCLWCSWLGFGFGLLMGRVWFRARPACPPPFPVPAWGVGVRAGPGSRLCPALLGWVVGVCFLRFFSLFLLLGVPVPGLVVPVPPSPSFRAGLLALFLFFSFFFSFVVCFYMFGCPFSRMAAVSWLGVTGFGWVVPLCLFWGPVFGAFWRGGLGRLWWCWRAVWWLWAVFAPPPSPLCCFFFLGGGGGGGCLFLPLPSLGWRTHWPAFSVVFRAAVGGCVLFRRVPAPWVGWAMYTVGLAPLPAGLGSASAGWAAAPGGCLWLWVRGLGLFVSFPLCGACFNLVGGPPPLLPGALWPRVWPALLVCGVLVRRLPGCAMACFG